MKRWKLCDLVPPGTSGELQGLLCLLVMICAFLYSVWKYAAALTHGPVSYTHLTLPTIA